MEYNKKEGIGKKFVEGLLVSVVIMGLFFLLQLLLGSVSVLAAVTACILQTDMDIQEAQRAGQAVFQGKGAAGQNIFHDCDRLRGAVLSGAFDCGCHRCGKPGDDGNV